MNSKPQKKIEVVKNVESGYSELTLKQLFYTRKYLQPENHQKSKL